MRPHLTRRTAVKTLFCGVACFGLPDCFVKRIFPAGPALAFSQEYNPGYELGEKVYVPVRSSVLNEDRTAEVILPREFKDRVWRIEIVRVNLRLDVCPRDSEFADAATPAKIGRTVTTFMSILSTKSTIC